MTNMPSAEQIQDKDKWIDAPSRSADTPRMEYCENLKRERSFTFVQYKDTVMVPETIHLYFL